MQIRPVQLHSTTTPRTLILPKERNGLPQYPVVLSKAIKDLKCRLVVKQKNSYAHYVGDKFGVNILMIKRNWVKDKRNNIKRTDIAYIEPIMGGWYDRVMSKLTNRVLMMMMMFICARDRAEPIGSY